MNLNSPNNTELAWAAGFFDGEGCSYTSRWTRKDGSIGEYVRMAVYQKELEPIERFCEAVGIGKVAGPHSKGRTSPLWYWNATSDRAQVAMGRLWPYLSGPKRRQFLEKGGHDEFTDNS